MKYVASLALAMVTATAAGATRPATEQEVEAIRNGMERQLADARSARFDTVQVDDEGHICGLVNAKNRMGAYVGYQAFTGMLFEIDGKLTAIPMGVGEDSISRKMCASKGFVLPP